MVKESELTVIEVKALQRAHAETAKNRLELIQKIGVTGHHRFGELGRPDLDVRLGEVRRRLADSVDRHFEAEVEMEGLAKAKFVSYKDNLRKLGLLTEQGLVPPPVFIRRAKEWAKIKLAMETKVAGEQPQEVAEDKELPKSEEEKPFFEAITLALIAKQISNRKKYLESQLGGFPEELIPALRMLKKRAGRSDYANFSRQPKLEQMKQISRAVAQIIGCVEGSECEKVYGELNPEAQTLVVFFLDHKKDRDKLISILDPLAGFESSGKIVTSKNGTEKVRKTRSQEIEEVAKRATEEVLGLKRRHFSVPKLRATLGLDVARTFELMRKDILKPDLGRDGHHPVLDIYEAAFANALLGHFNEALNARERSELRGAIKHILDEKLSAIEDKDS